MYSFVKCGLPTYPLIRDPLWTVWVLFVHKYMNSKYLGINYLVESLEKRKIEQKSPLYTVVNLLKIVETRESPQGLRVHRKNVKSP